MKTLKHTIRQVKYRLLQTSRHIGHTRLARLAAMSLILWSVFVPVFSFVGDVHAYQLSPATKHIVGTANANLSAKFSYDQQNDVWQFNKTGQAVQAAAIARQQGTSATDVGAALSHMQAQVGGGGKNDTSLYSVDLPSEAAKGMTFYDNQTSQSFKLLPRFKIRDGKNWQGRVVYPFGDGGQIVYTAKTNGIKEDIVLNKNVGDALQFNYQLELPSTLQAKIGNDGSIGIYSADPALYGNITYGAGADRAKIDSARQNAPKDHLVFGIPAPLIKDANGQQERGVYRLDGNNLQVSVHGLNSLHYPLSVDPSVVITSSSDFQTGGNNEGMIDFNTAGQITRGFTSGATLSAGWNSTTSLPTTRLGLDSVAYNGFLYMAGGASGASQYNDVQYAAINSDGTIGGWSTTASFTTARQKFNLLAYNGYLYVLGGYDGTSTYFNDVQYAPINANGTVGAWATTTSFSTARARARAAVYNGYLYVLGGDTGGSSFSDVQYAPINANGTVGAWATTTSLTVGLYGFGLATYNGYMYVLGGYSTSARNNVQYIQINGDGSLGSWLSTTSFTNARSTLRSVVYNGYVYVMGGYNSTSSTYYNDVQYAQINANGTVGAWNTTTSFTNGRNYFGAALYNGIMYVLGGSNATTTYSDVQYATIDQAGKAANYTAVTAPASGLTNIGSGRSNGATAVYNGCIYLVGGTTGGAFNPQVYQASIAADGSLGTWSVASNTLNAGVSAFGFSIYNGFMYVVGGIANGTNSNAVQYASFNASGCGTSAWTTNATNYPGAISSQPGAAYNGYLYQMGDSGAGVANHLYTAQINSDGSVGTWNLQSSVTLTTARQKPAMMIYGGYIYIVGGYDTSMSVAAASVEYAPIASPGVVTTNWKLTSSMNVGRTDFGIYIYNGYIYALGGDDGNVTAFNSTESVKINANGSLGGGSGTTWSYNSSLADSHANFGIAGYDDKVYLVSGKLNGTTTNSRNVYSVTLNNGGSGRVNSWNTAANNFTNLRRGQSTVAYNGYLYVAGGFNNTTYYNDVQYAAINPDGTIGSWATTTSLPSSVLTFGMVAYNNYLYVMGGSDGTSLNNAVQYAAINANGTIGSWHYTHNSIDDGTTFVSGFSTARANLATALYKGYVYVLGGRNSGGTTLSDVQYAPLNKNGTIGSWTLTSSFTNSRRDMGALAYNGYIYIVGGYTGSTEYSDVQYAALNANGSVSAWTTSSSFMTARDSFQLFAYNGNMYIIGGSDISSNILSDVQYAPFTTSGQLGNWTYGPMTGNARKSASSATYNGFLYILGGLNGTSKSDVQYGALSTVARTGIYSKLINLPSAGTVSAVNYNGSLSPESTVQYRIAGVNGLFGSRQAGASGNGANPASSCVAGTDQYVWVTVSFDDSNTMQYGGGYTPSSLTDLTVYYGLSSRPSPNSRLYGGKSFQDESQTPLDTCGV